MTKAAEIMKQIHKDHGSNMATVGLDGWEDIERIPTGIFALDLAMGGGWPQGKCSIIYGPESSCKSNVAYKSAGQAQIKFGTKFVVVIDPEFALDKPWAAQMGVDLDRLIVVNPETAEQSVDFVETFTMAEDVSMVILDSLAALVTSNEIEKDASTTAVGGASALIGKMYRKVGHSQRAMANAGKDPVTFLAVNQIRHKIGVMFGNPETMPGGNAPKFSASMILRVYGKNIMDNKVNKTTPRFKEVNAVLQKWKCPILSQNAVFQMQMIRADGKDAGWVKDWGTVSKFMKELDYLSPGEKSGWIMNGDPYQTLDDCYNALYGDPELLQSMKTSIIVELMEKGGVAAQVEAEAEEA